MYSVVKRLRDNGARRSIQSIQSDHGLLGRVTLCLVAGIPHLSIHAAGDDAQRRPLIPELVHATMTAMHGDKLLFRGLERNGDAEFAQEWSVMVNASPPADIPQPTTRLG